MLIASIVSFLKHIEDVKKYSLHTVRNYSMDLDSFLDFVKNSNEIKFKHPRLFALIQNKEGRCWQISNDIDISLLSRAFIRGFLAHLYSEGKCRRTILRSFASIKSLCNFLLSESLLDSNPTEHIDNPKKPNANFPVIEQDIIFDFFEQTDLSSFKGFRDRCIMEVLYCTGMRVSELSEINISDISFSELSIKIKCKGKQERVVFLNTCVAEWLKAYINHPKRKEKIIDHEAVFINCFGTRINPRSIDRMFKFYLAKSGISYSITPHTLRRALACHYLSQGIDIKKIKSILGHSALASTTAYAKATNALKVGEYMRAHPRS